MKDGQGLSINATLRTGTLDGGFCCWLDEVQGKVVSSFTLCCAESGMRVRSFSSAGQPMFLSLLFIEGLSQGPCIDFCLDKMG